jgi:hypothetical protein
MHGDGTVICELSPSVSSEGYWPSKDSVMPRYHTLHPSPAINASGTSPTSYLQLLSGSHPNKKRCRGFHMRVQIGKRGTQAALLL